MIDGPDVHRFSVIPAAYVILRRRREVLLQLRRNTGYMDDYWACSAAGHVERGESVIEAAVRETREELGITVAAGDLRPVCTMHRTQHHDDPTSERADFFFVLERWRGTPRIAEIDKAASLEWFTLVDLPPNVVPHERVVVEPVLAGSGLPAVVTYGF